MSKHFKEILKDIENGVYEKTETIGPVDYYLLDKTPYSFHFYATYTNKNGKPVLVEMLYDLRYKEYFIKRNGREVKFSIDNLDTVIPRVKDTYYVDQFHTKENAIRFFKMVSVQENEGMYEVMMEAIGAFYGERIDMSSRALIRLIEEYHKLELLYKAGINISGISHFPSILVKIKEASQNNYRKAHQVLGVSKSQLNFLKEFATNNMFNLITKVNILVQQDMDEFRGYMQWIKKLEEQYDIGEDRLLEFLTNGGSLNSFIEAKRWVQNNRTYISDSRNIYKFMYQYNHPNPKKLIEYLLFECYLSQGMNFHTAIYEYTDYYRMCLEMEYERFERYPKYLKTYHDIVARNYKIAEDEITVKNFKRNVENYRKLEDKIGRDFRMIVPEEPHDLVTEGNVLGHCVASYVRNVAKGKTAILFLRKADDVETPYITVEVKNGVIVQYRGRGNRLPADREEAAKVVKAIKAYAKKKDLEVAAYG